MLGQSLTIDRHLTLFHLSVVSLVLETYFGARHGDGKTSCAYFAPHCRNVFTTEN